MEPIELTALREEYGKNKIIPSEYEKQILIALSHYPELKDTRIRFSLKKKHPVPYGTMPSFRTLLSQPANREYTISILEKAKAPMEQALLKNLPFEAQIGVFGHEIAHVVQYSSCDRAGLLKFLLMYLHPAFQKTIERAADLTAITHGLGNELLKHAIFIRCIPGYAKERKEININYLKPAEIAEYLKTALD